jgi:glutamate-ammonia-ligase adenylyltransferase
MMRGKPVNTILRRSLESNDRKLLEELMASRGFRLAERAAANLHRVADDDRVRPLLLEIFPLLLKELSQCADPDMALNNLERFANATIDRYSLFVLLRGSPVAVQLLVKIFAFSQFLADVLIRNPEYLEWILQKDTLEKEKTEADYALEVSAAIRIFRSLEAKRNALCRLKRKEMLRIGTRDLLGLAVLRQVTRELSFLANAIIQAALALCYETLVSQHGPPLIISSGANKRECRFCIMGMGKLGGQELNYSSDVDLVFFYEDEGETAGGSSHEQEPSGIISNHKFFTRLCERLIAFLSEVTPEGRLYRVDTRLRPEGVVGPITRSVESVRTYFLTQARLWEKLAYLKASTVAGDAELGLRLEQIIEQFTFDPMVSSQSLIAEVRSLKDRIDHEALTPEMQHREVKCGYGGIREIEFLVNTLQLIGGLEHKALRAKATLDALAELHRLNMLSQSEYELLDRAYRFLRTVEHRLQIMSDLQIHLLPTGDQELHGLALRVGTKKTRRTPLADTFRQTYARLTSRVHRLFRKYLQLEAAKSEQPDEQRLFACLEADSITPEARRLLKRSGFREDSTFSSLRSMAYGTRDTYVTSEGQQFFAALFPRLLALCRDLPFPDSAVRNLDSLLRAAKGMTGYYEILAEQPAILELLLRVLGTSDYLARILIAHPEYLDALLSPEDQTHLSDAHVATDELIRQIDSEQSLDENLKRVRRAKELWLLQLGTKDIVEKSLQDTLAKEISTLAEACVNATWNVLLSHLSLPEYDEARIRPFDPDAPLCMLAMGGFGAHEITYFSDLDLIFVYNEPDTGAKDAVACITPLVEKFISTMSAITPEGMLFKIDTQLRPEGAGSPLVVTHKRFMDYYQETARVWEWQSFLRCRAIGSNHAAGRAIIGTIQRYIQKAVRGADLVEEIRTMRRRLEESVRVPSWGLADFKRGKGGLVDIEFLVQYLQLQHCQNHPELWITNTLEALEQLKSLGLVAKPDAEVLIRAYQFLRAVEARVRLMFETPKDIFPKAPARLEPLEKALRHTLAPSGSLTDTFLHTTRSVRELFNKYVA